jgi:hypothetical protein
MPLLNSRRASAPDPAPGDPNVVPAKENTMPTDEVLTEDEREHLSRFREAKKDREAKAAAEAEAQTRRESVSLDDIKPGMTAEKKALAHAAIAEALKQNS